MCHHNRLVTLKFNSKAKLSVPGTPFVLEALKSIPLAILLHYEGQA